MRLWCSFCEIQANIPGVVLAAGRHSSAKNITHYCEQPAVCHIRSGGTLPTAVEAASGCYNTAAAVTHRKWLGFVWVGVRPVWLNWACVCASEWGFLHTWGCQMLPKPPDSWASCSWRRSKAEESPRTPSAQCWTGFGSNAEIICSSPVFNQECDRNDQRIGTHTLGQFGFLPNRPALVFLLWKVCKMLLTRKLSGVWTKYLNVFNSAWPRKWEGRRIEKFSSFSSFLSATLSQLKYQHQKRKSMTAVHPYGGFIEL